MTDLSSYTSAVGTELFFKADISGHPLLFSDGDIIRTIGSDTYTNRGSLLSISQTESNISVTPFDLSVTIDGIQAANVAAATSPDVKYSPVTLLRAWIDPATDVVIATETRYKGFISSVTFEESWAAPEAGFTISFKCISSVNRLTDHVAGRRTNNADQLRFFPGDTSFKRVATITNANFNFGVPNANPTAGTRS